MGIVETQENLEFTIQHLRIIVFADINDICVICPICLINILILSMHIIVEHTLYDR